MKIDPNIDNEIFQVLRDKGFTRPSLNLSLWFKNNMLCRFAYEVRESASFHFGVSERTVDLHFPDSPPGWWQSRLKPYQFWLATIGYDPSEFSHACGGWEEGGLRTPDFGRLKSIIAATLPLIESGVSNILMNRDARQRPLS